MNLHIMPDWHAYSMTLPEFNDTVHQTQLFLSQSQQVELILVDYLPQLREILSQKRIESAVTWSAYDLFQRITLKDEKPVALADFSWPDDAEFIRMNDRIEVWVKNTHFATVWVQQSPLMRFDRIDLLTDDIRRQELIIDDRGFISRVTTFNDDNEPIRRDYLTPSGGVAVQEDCVSAVVTTQQTWTPQTTFTNMAELVAAGLAHHLKSVPQNDYLIVSQSEMTTFLIHKVTPKQPVILSYQTERTDRQLEQHVPLQISGNVDFSVIDTPEQAEKLSAQSEQQSTFAIIPPYTVTARQNNVAVQPVATIYWFAPSIAMADFEVVSTLLASHPNVLVLIETTQSHALFDAMIEAASKTAANAHGIIDVDSQLAYKTRFQFIASQNEAQKMQYMANSRVLLDLGDTPNQYLQTQAIAYAVPQINRIQTAYLQPNQNGKLVTDRSELSGALNFYVDDTHWVSDVKESTHDIAAEYSDDMVWIKWQQIFNKIK
ncbi:accessory Sec system protein Asp1 [Leuconostoc rapi]|uniref:accessory Sec system protein Asp1 n=1 Tax=Leuconostoc rapi TaxID=1406906 RepID=UPI00195EB32D|nr:accessory Sec system protein Asp1 [Leuconostoc rapi]MBM7436097.1 accessory secretory protein Asp1 [Leuconostoc rapi]